MLSSLIKSNTIIDPGFRHQANLNPYSVQFMFFCKKMSIPKNHYSDRKDTIGSNAAARRAG